LAHSAHQISFCDSAHESLCGPQHDPQRPHVLSTNTQAYAHGSSGIVFDTTYADFEHLHDIVLRGMRRVTRAKGTFGYQALRNLPSKKSSNVINVSELRVSHAAWLPEFEPKGATSHRKKYPPDFADNPSKTSTRTPHLPQLAQ
jgi:hypothetical protein